MPLSEQNPTDPEYSREAAPLQVSDQNSPLQPLLFNPLIKRICWGGTRLGDVLNKPIGSADDYAESWELSDLPDSQSEVACGPHAGWTLSDLRRIYREQLLGTDSPFANFPLLIKFLDIQDKLSIQVHPDDHLALQLTGGIGKTETWIILDSEPGSLLYAGLKEGVDRQQFETALAEDRVVECLHAIEVKAGDAIHLPAGTVHAVRGSMLLAEVQQASDLSFRLHDWHRDQHEGLDRELHVEEALLCTNFDQGPISTIEPQVVKTGPHTESVLIDCPHYTIRRHTSSVSMAFEQDDRFRVLVILEGTGELQCLDFREKVERGQTWLIPACCREIHLTPQSDKLTLLDVFID
ncbi:MAG: mannose-6-phosphate isomerase [Planctomyces sp.]|nr:mannose-6-phosphate isomerase [Planctomyces sp.]